MPCHLTEFDLSKRIRISRPHLCRVALLYMRQANICLCLLGPRFPSVSISVNMLNMHVFKAFSLVVLAECLTASILVVNQSHTLPLPLNVTHSNA